jgi:ribosomal protein S17
MVAGTRFYARMHKRQLAGCLISGNGYKTVFVVVEAR